MTTKLSEQEHDNMVKIGLHMLDKALRKQLAKMDQRDFNSKKAITELCTAMFQAGMAAGLITADLVTGDGELAKKEGIEL